MLAERSRAIQRLLRKLYALRRDLENNRDAAEELVNLVSALTIPRGWIGLDAEGSLHVTWYSKSDTIRPVELSAPTSIMMEADFVWSYDQAAGTVRCVKSRTGRHGETFQCNPPTGVVT